MRWTKLKQLVEQGFAQSLGKRLAIYSAAYGNCSCGHAWLTLDGDIIANFCTRASGNLRYSGTVPNSPNKMYEEQFVGYGEISRQDAYQACWTFVHDLSIDEALTDKDVLVQTLAVVDRRLGKRRLQQIDGVNLHPLVNKLRSVRLEAEGIAPVQPNLIATTA